MAQDGRNWARIEGDHHTGALFDVGEEGEWDELFIGHPQGWQGCASSLQLSSQGGMAKRSRFVQLGRQRDVMWPAGVARMHRHSSVQPCSQSSGARRGGFVQLSSQRDVEERGGKNVQAVKQPLGFGKLGWQDRENPTSAAGSHSAMSPTACAPGRDACIITAGISAGTGNAKCKMSFGTCLCLSSGIDGLVRCVHALTCLPQLARDAMLDHNPNELASVRNFMRQAMVFCVSIVPACGLLMTEADVVFLGKQVKMKGGPFTQAAAASRNECRTKQKEHPCRHVQAAALVITYTGSAVLDSFHASSAELIFIGAINITILIACSSQFCLYRFVVGMASSADGFIWKKQGVVFDPVEQGAQPSDHDGLGASSRQVVSCDDIERLATMMDRMFLCTKW
eukprot:1151445-Pelagomonas_calceolata.AAC.8